MPRINRSSLVNFSAMQMYLLVNDVLSYPEFINSCESSSIIKASETELIAKVDVTKLGVHKSFTTRNYMIPGERITLTLVEGPLRKLNGEWRFIAISDKSCKVEFEMVFEFSNSLSEFIFNKVFNEIANSMVKVFNQRAQEIYCD